MKIDKIRIPRWFYRHLHLRDGDMLKWVLPCTLKQRAIGAVVMGNLKHPDETSTEGKARAYFFRIAEFLTAVNAPRLWDSDFKPCMTLYLTDDIKPEEVVRGYHAGVWCAAKLYIAGQGGTTNSGHGVNNLLGRYSVFAAMEKYHIPLLGHFEAVEPEVDEFYREAVSLERDLIPLLKTFPGLPVVVEHVTDGRMADFVAESSCNVYATVTAHHLMINRNAMFQGGMCPVNYCKPVAKREEHRLKVRRHVTSGNKRFGAGTDSAPHDEMAKARCYGCAAGIFTAPCAVEMYATVFDEDNALQHLGSFLSSNFLDIYGVEPSTEMMEIERQQMRVPKSVGTVQVFQGGTMLPWRLV